jgi:alpha-N-acetylglucosamine transferase
MHFRSTKSYLFLISFASTLCILYVYMLNILGTSSGLRQIHLQVGKHNHRFAYSTFLSPAWSVKDNLTAFDDTALKDPYFVSVRLLNYQIKHAHNTKTTLNEAPFLVLVLSDVPTNQVEVLKAEGATIVPIEPLELPAAFDRDFIENSRFKYVLSKLRLWQLTNYDKILYIDADSFLLANLDDIFTDPDLSTPMLSLTTNDRQGDKSNIVVSPPDTYLLSASADTYGDQTEWEEPGHVNYLCACFMLISPSSALFSYYISILGGPNAPPNAAYPEQDLLIYAHRPEGPMPWKRIPIRWSANDGEMNDELALMGGVRSLHIKGWEGAEGGNVANEKYMRIWRDLVKEMEKFYSKE